LMHVREKKKFRVKHFYQDLKKEINFFSLFL
jgi:hypothetical protein